MLLALFINPSPQFEELLELPNQELFDPDGSHDDELEFIEGNQFEEALDGNQFDADEHWDEDENIVDPSTTPTPKPMPKTARTVEMG
jgi:hypothetical protein